MNTVIGSGAPRALPRSALPFHPVPPALPQRGLVVLCGPAGSGKSTWAQALAVEPAAIVSSDALRGVLTGDEADQSATPLAFRLLHTIVRERLRRNRLVIVDSTALELHHRRRLLAMARLHRRPAGVVLFDVPLPLLHERNRNRDRRVPEDVVVRQQQLFARAVLQIETEGFDAVWVAGPPATSRGG